MQLNTLHDISHGVSMGRLVPFLSSSSSCLWLSVYARACYVYLQDNKQRIKLAITIHQTWLIKEG